MSIILLIKTACFGLFSTLYINAFSQEHTFSKSQPVYISHDGQVIHPDSIPEQYKQKREYPDSWIVEFKGEPLSKKPAGLKSASLNAYQNTFTNFENDLNNIASSGNNLKSGKIIKVNRKFKNAFFGASINNVSSSSLEQIKKLSYVKTVYPNQTVKGHLAESTGIINAPTARLKHGVTGAGVKVGIIDSGIDYMHPALGGGLGEGYKVAGGYDFVNDDNDPMDDYFHGTHVAGIVASQDETYMGIAPDVTLYALKCLNQYNEGQEDDIIAAIEWSLDPNGDGNFEDKLDIINLSLGSSNGNALDAKSIAVNNVSEAGVLCVVSAGNDGGFNNIGSPGTAEKALTVGNCSKELQMAQNSSGGPSGGNGYIKPEVVAPGENITAPILNGEFGSNSGTSQAAPHVTGICALLKEKHPEWTPEEIKSAIIQSCTPLNDIGVMKQGAGLVDAEKALNCETMISPAIVNLGNISFENNFYTKEIQLSFKNESQSQKTYSLAQKNRRYGIDISFAESAFTLNPGEKKQITAIFEIPVGAIPNEVPFSGANSIDGLIEVTEDGHPVSLPWAIIKGVKVKFKVIGEWDKFFSSFFITNESNYYNKFDGYIRSDSSFTLIIKPGIYHLLFDGTELIENDNFFNHRIVLKDSLKINSDTTIVLDLTQTHLLSFEGVDNEGNLLNEGEYYRKNIGIKLPDENLRTEYVVNIFDDYNAIFVSNYNSTFTLYPFEYSDQYLNMGKYTILNHPPLTELSQPVSFINNPSNYFKTSIKTVVPDNSPKPMVLVPYRIHGKEEYVLNDPDFMGFGGFGFSHLKKANIDSINIYIQTNNSEEFQFGFDVGVATDSPNDRYQDEYVEYLWKPLKLVNNKFRMGTIINTHYPLHYLPFKSTYSLPATLIYPRLNLDLRPDIFGTGSTYYGNIVRLVYYGMQEEQLPLKNSNVHIVLSNDSLQIVHQHNYQMGERDYPRIQADEGNYFYYLFKDSYSGLVKYKASISTNNNLAQGNAGTIKLLQIFNSENEITNKLNVNEKAKINLVLWDGPSDFFTSKCFYKLNGEFKWKEVEFTTDSIKKDHAFVYQHCNLPEGLSEGVYDLKIKFTNPQNHSAELTYQSGLTVGSPEINNSVKIGELPDTSCYAGDVLYYEIPVTGFRYDSCYFEADIFNKDVQLNVVGNELAIGADKASEGNYEIFLRLYKSNSFIEGKSFNLHVNKNDLVLSNEINDTTVYINSPPLVIPVQNVLKSLSDKEIAISIAGNTNPEMAIPRLENGNIYFDFNDYVFGYSTITLKAKTTDSIFTSFIVERQRWSFDYTDNSLPITGFTVTKYLNKIVMPSGSDTIIDLKNWFYHQTTGINEIRKEITYLSNDIIDAKILGDSLQITSKDDFSGSSVIFFKAFNIEGQEILLKIDVKVIEEALNQSPVVSEEIDDIVFSGTYDEQIFINLANKFKDPDGDLISYSLFVEKPSVVNGFIDNNYAVIVPMNGEEMVYSERNKVWEKKWSKWTRASVTATDIHGASTSQVFWIRYGDCNNENNIQIRREFEDLITSSENIANIEYRVDSYFTNTFDAEVTSSNKSIAYGYTNDRDRMKLGSNGEFGTCEITVKAYNPECGFSVSQSFNVTVIPEITEIKAIQDTVVVCKNEHFKLNLFLKGYDSEGSTFDLNSGVSWQDDDGIWDGNREYICNWGFCRTFFAEYNGLYDTLTVCPSQTEDFFDVRYICQGDSAFLGGGWVWEQDYYRDTLQSVQGCDSIGLVLLVITEFNNIPEIVIENYNDICIGDSIRLRTKQHNNDWDYEWSNGKPGQSIYAKESGEYRLRYTAKSNPNCSSEWSEPVMVTFHEPAYIDTSTSICEGKTYEFGTQILTQAGEYTEVFETINGCDSTVVLTLAVNPVYNHTDAAEICQGETYEFGTQSLIQTGEYTEVFESKNGCDSTVTLTLTVHPVFNTEVDVSICEGSSHKGWTQPGTYSENLVSVSGCDSTVVTRLSVTPLPATPVLTQNADTLIASGQGVFTWYLENNLINDALSSDYIIKNSGNYSVSVTDEQGCVSKVSVSIFVVKTSTQNQYLNKLMVYPNPTTGKVTIEGLEATGKTLLSVFDNLGRELLKREVHSTRAEVNLAGFAPGVYNITVVQGSHKAGFQVIKQ